MLDEIKDIKNRLHWVDSAKAVGMFLVYFGHIVQEMANKDIQYSFFLTKLVYSFHMPMFFIMAGFFFKRRYQSKWSEIRVLFLKRLVPVFYFGGLTLLLWPVYLYLTYGRINWNEIGIKMVNYLQGHPDLNTITWFIVCLFMVEVISIFALHNAEKTISGLFIAALFLYFGLRMTANFQATVISLGIGKNVWYIHEALVAFGLYAIGFTMFKLIKSLSHWNPFLRLFLAVISFGLTLFTFNLNNPYEGFVVIMKTSNHGSPFYFIQTAILGTISVILIASLLPQNRLLDYIGKNSLTFVATSGLFHHLINPFLVIRLENFVSGPWIIVLSIIIAVISLGLSFPLVWLVNKITPQLVGRPLQDGPYLPNLDFALTNLCNKLTQIKVPKK